MGTIFYRGRPVYSSVEELLACQGKGVAAIIEAKNRKLAVVLQGREWTTYEGEPDDAPIYVLEHGTKVLPEEAERLFPQLLRAGYRYRR